MKYHVEFLQLFCQRLLRPADVTFLKTKNGYLRIPKLLSTEVLLIHFNLSEPIHKIQFNVRYPV